MPAAAELLPRPERLTGSEPMLRELAEMLVGREADPRIRLARLDAMLAQLREPNETRGLVQHIRAVHLSRLGRTPEARLAAEESIRLLPGYSGPLFLASEIDAYADRPASAADFLVRASEIDPELARRMPSYEVDNLIRRLAAHEDLRRLGRLSERLVAIDWTGDDVALRSQVALEAIKSRIRAGDAEGAKALVPRLIAPSHIRSLLIDNRYRDLWPDLEAWGGSRQERQWRIYLSELRARFESSGDPEAASRYADALRAANHHRTIVTKIAPLFARQLDRLQDYNLVWAATTVGDAYARLGRWAEIEPLFERAARTWPLGLDANALNVAGNRARLLLYAGRFAEAAEALDRVIENAEGYAGQVSVQAIATMHLYRACALHELGRDHAAVQSAANVLGSGDPLLAVTLHLCFDRHDAARAALIGALQEEASRTSVIHFLQPFDAPPMQSPYGRTMEARTEALRRDPLLLREVARFGRILPYASSAGAPPEE
jgi:tetratricopeptide (TPR) repeat protein